MEQQLGRQQQTPCRKYCTRLLFYTFLTAAASDCDGFNALLSSECARKTVVFSHNGARVQASQILRQQHLTKQSLVVTNNSSRNNAMLRFSTAATSESSSEPLDSNQNIVDRIRSRIRSKQVRKNTEKSTSYQWTKQNLAIALPALMGLLADPLLSIVDTAFVGRSVGGAIDLAALGVCTSIFHMAFTVFRASTVATTSLVGSASTPEEKRQTTKISMGFALAMGTLVFLSLRLAGGHMLTGMAVAPNSDVFRSACSYLYTRSWAAPAVLFVLVAEGAFRGNGDSKTPLVAASVAAVVNLILDPLLMFPLRMGMAGAAAATAISQIAAATLYAWRLWKRQLLPQPQDSCGSIKAGKVVKGIIGANAAMLSKNFSMLVFYTAATTTATRIGAAHVATHQVCLSLFWLLTMWLDSGGVSAQLLLSKSIGEGDSIEKIKSLTKYMVKFALVQGLAFSTFVCGIGRYVPAGFTQDPVVSRYIMQCIPQLCMQMVLISLCLVLEGLAIGGKQFRFMASGTAVATAVGLWQMRFATSVVDIWSGAVNTFFGLRLLNGIIGVARVHMGLKKKTTTDCDDSIVARI